MLPERNREEKKKPQVGNFIAIDFWEWSADTYKCRYNEAEWGDENGHIVKYNTAMI